MNSVMLDDLTYGRSPMRGTNGAAHGLEQGQIGGERNVTSTTNNYDVIKNECNVTVISATTAITIGGGAVDDTYLLGVHIHTALAGTCVIAGFADETGAAKSYTLPIGAVGHIPFYGARNTAGALTVTCSTAGDDDKVAIMWRPR